MVRKWFWPVTYVTIDILNPDKAYENRIMETLSCQFYNQRVISPTCEHKMDSGSLDVCAFLKTLFLKGDDAYQIITF